jgi:hypothetical protein
MVGPHRSTNKYMINSAVLEIRITLMRIRILLFTLYAVPNQIFHYNVDPDPASHFDADTDTVSQMMRIHADSDPQHFISE